LSPFPLHLLPAFALPRASLERFGPLVPTNTRGPTFCFGTHGQGLLGRGRKQASPVLYPGPARRGQPLVHRRGGLARVRDRGQWQSAAASPVHLKRTE
ncbi:hypothetical protein U0070_011744, partial [Myodes glareolus]